jgi:urea carboxylase-associated protein 2
VKKPLYSYTLPGASHWSLRMRRGHNVTLTDLEGGANLGMLMYNPEDLFERYNAPDTLKCQHPFKLTKGHCLYSDMGRIFCSITEDTVGWHETVCGTGNAQLVSDRWGARDYQNQRNMWKQNGYDAFLVELAKYGLNGRDMAANVNWFSRVDVDEQGALRLQENNSSPGSSVTLRFEMDALVVLHTCPHPLNQSDEYPRKPVLVEISRADPVAEDDYCRNRCSENQRGFANNQLYYFGMQ